MLSARARRRFVRHHLPIALACALMLPLVAAVARGRPGIAFRWSMATAYVGLALLAVTLMLGPFAALRGKRHPVSNDFRRDVGIWAGVMAVVHFVVGWQVHMEHRYEYFFRESPSLRSLPVRYDVFGLANYVGLAAVVVAAVLLAISNDRSLRALGAVRWKRWQRFSYWFFALVLLHGAAYQVIEHRVLPFVAAAAIVSGIAVALQLQGLRTRRRVP